MKNGRFEVGDRVIGNKFANEHYGITVQGWIGIVTEILQPDYSLGTNFDTIKVRDFYSNSEFDVNHKCFDLYEQERKKDKGIFIKGVSLPHCCGECVAFDSCGCKFINIDNSFNVWKNRAPNCPMKESK